MRDLILRMAALAALWAIAAGSASAQPGPPRGPIGSTADLQVTHQGDADIDGGGSFSATRAFAQGQIAWIGDARTSVGLSLGAGRTHFDFSGGIAAPWGDVTEARISLPVRFGVGERGSAFVIPSLRFAAEEGADLSDGQTAGLFGAIVWRINDRLTIGPGVGVFEELSGDIDYFPILAIEWGITDRVSLSTLRGIGATQGPGLGLIYEATDALDIGVAARFDSAEFRLADDNAAPGGVGKVGGRPIVATLSWSPNPGLSASAFAGVDLDGEIEVYGADDTLVSRREYDPAPVVGGQFTLRF